MKFKVYIYPIICICIFLLSLVSNWHQELSIALFCTLLLSVIDKLGHGLVLREAIAFYYSLNCLVMPIMGYNVFNSNNYLAWLFAKYMMVPQDFYFNFALPAIALFSFIIIWPLSSEKALSDHGKNLQLLISGLREHVEELRPTGIKIIIVGVLASLIAHLLPGGLGFVAMLFYLSSFAGLLYLYYSPKTPHKFIYITLFILFILANALATGMFTLVAYMGITIFSFFFLGNKMSLFKKVLVVFAGVFFLLVLQNTKTAFRKMTWGRAYGESKALLFANLFLESMQESGNLINNDELFPVYVRLNQGFNISLVMRRIPQNQPHDNGQQLLKVAAASIVPRVLWPDKPMAGGKFNMMHYAGVRLVGWSTNVGPLGEAYGSFGVTRGILYIGMLAFFIRFAYVQFFRIANSVPLLICWLPILFFQTTYSSETDTLQILNSILKGAFFLFLLYKLVPDWFRIKSKKIMARSLGR